MRRLFPLLLVFILSSCVYFDAGREDILQRLGNDGDTVVYVDTSGLRSSSLAPILPEGDIYDRVTKLSVVISAGEFSAVAQGKLSSTEVGTALIWSPQFVRRSEEPRYYHSKDMGLSAGSIGEGLMLITSGDYEAEYASIFSGRMGVVAPSDAALMMDALIGVYVSEPSSLSSFDTGIPAESFQKMESVLLLISEGEENAILDGRIIMSDEESARALQIILRNMLVQEIRRKGERLDVKAISDIFTYEGSVLRISGYSLKRDVLESFISRSAYAVI